MPQKKFTIKIKNGKLKKLNIRSNVKKLEKNGYKMPEHLRVGTIITDMSKQQWKIGTFIGSGGFGEIYSARKTGSVHLDNYPYVVKIVT